MLVYRTGIIGEAIHARIESVKNGEKVTESFSDTLRSMMETTDKVKPVGLNASAVTDIPRSISGDSLIYAIRNSDTDTTASSVLNALGLGGTSSATSLKTAADALSSEIKKTTDIADAADENTTKTQIAALADKYNSLLSQLSVTSSNSGIMYTNLLKLSAKSASEQLSEAGLTIDEKGMLRFEPTEYKSADLTQFLTSTASTASAVSSYASTIKSQTTSSILGLGSDSDDDSGSLLSSYYNALTGFYT